jgi:phospholipid transport system transporter-binding protein
MTSIALPSRLTMGDASATLARLTPLLQAADEPVIDASALRELDTAALAVLLACARQAGQGGRRLRVLGAPPKLGELARLYGVDVLLDLTEADPPVQTD